MTYRFRAIATSAPIIGGSRWQVLASARDEATQ